MPKIIENVRDQLLDEAAKQMEALDYSQITVRSVASACGLGLGTVYNYFKSKEMLIATVIFRDWKKYLEIMRGLQNNDPEALFGGIFKALRDFADEKQNIFSDPNAAKLISASSSMRHKMLRDQIAAFILPLCKSENVAYPEFTSEFISESLICWSMENRNYSDVYPQLLKLLKSKI